MFNGQISDSMNTFENPRQETVYAIILSVGIFLFFTLSIIWRNQGATPVFTWTLKEVIWYWVLYGTIMIIPVVAFLYLRKNNHKTVGLHRQGLEMSIMMASFIIFLECWGLGMLVSALFLTPVIILSWVFEHNSADSERKDKFFKFIQSPKFLLAITTISVVGIAFYTVFGGVFKTGEPIISLSALNSILAHTAQVGAEELVFRGLLQFRAVEWLGEKKGILLTAVIFSFGHFPVLVFNGMDIGSILFTLILFCLFSIFLGYLAHKTQNITGGFLIHLSVNFF